MKESPSVNNVSQSPSNPSKGSGSACHTPMSERQQLALIKQMERSGSSSTSSDCSPCVTSPPRTPLGVLNGILSTPNSRTTPASSARATPTGPSGNTPKTPAEERVLKKVSKRNHRGETPLQCAAIKGNPGLVRKLLRLGADPNSQDYAGWSPLHEACNRGNDIVARILIKGGADIHTLGMYKETPLHDASRNGHLKVVKLLLKSGANKEALNAERKTPLEVARNPENPCTNPDLQRVVLLLQGNLDESGEEEERQERDKVRGSARGQLFTNMSTAEEVTSSTQQEDVYEFKTSSKEATPTSSRGSASPGGGEGGAEAGKREGDEEETAGGVKKRKKEDGGGRGRGVRGNSSEKAMTGKQGGGRGRGATATADRRTPPGSSARAEASPAPSPGKGKAGKPEGGGESEDEGEKGKDGSGLKVPPLKIVLNGGGNNSGGRDEDKKNKTSYNVVNANSEDGESSEGGGKGNDTENSATEEKSGSRVTRSRGGNTDEEGPSEAQVEEERKQSGNEYHFKKRMRNGLRGNQPEENNVGNGLTRPSGEPLTDIEKHLNIRKQIEQRRKNLFPVQPKPPQGFRDYLMNKKTYHLQGNTGKDSRIQPIPKIAPPPSLEGPFRDLFLSQENERYKLRMKHLVEKEKLVLAVEQEILRVHGRAARALANQSLPYSVCTILRDKEIYTPIDPNQEEKNRDIRSRYNGRLFISWLQDVDDKWEKIKEQMVLRHHNEAESLNAVQKMDWEWKLGEIPGPKNRPCADDLHVPMVQVSDDFDQLLS